MGITTMDTSIFDAFPNAIISGVWQIGTCQHGTVVGNTFNALNGLDVIIDEGYNSDINTTPEAINSDMLLYVKPCQMPKEVNKLLVVGQVVTALVSNYMLYNSATDCYYMITDAGVGKNQHTGRIEHIELKVVPTEVTNA